MNKIQELEKEIELLKQIKDLYELIAQLKNQWAYVPVYPSYPIYPQPYNPYPIITYCGTTAGNTPHFNWWKILQ